MRAEGGEQSQISTQRQQRPQGKRSAGEDTSGVRRGLVRESLRRPGASDFRRACPAANGWSRIFKGSGSAGWRFITNSIAGSLKLLGLVSVCDPKGSPGLAPQCFGTSHEISPPSTHPRFPGVDAVRPFTGLRRTQYHLKCNACWPARKLLGLRDPGGTPLRNLLRISG